MSSRHTYNQGDSLGVIELLYQLPSRRDNKNRVKGRWLVMCKSCYFLSSYTTNTLWQNKNKKYDKCKICSKWKVKDF